MIDFNASFGEIPFDIVTFVPNVASITFYVCVVNSKEGIECLYFSLKPVTLPVPSG